MILEVIVKPNSKKGPLVVAGSPFTIYLRERPVEGKANAALVKLLAEYFDVPKTSIMVKAGQKSHHKIIEIN